MRYVKRKNLPRIRPRASSTSSLVQKTLSLKNEQPKYLFNLIPVRSTPYATRTVGNIPLIKTKHNFFKNYFFPSAIIEWNNLDPNLRNSKSISVFKEKILNFIRPSSNYFFDCHNPKGTELIARLRPV